MRTLLDIEIMVAKTIAWVLVDPGDPAQNDRRANIVFVTALTLVLTAFFCVLASIRGGGGR